MKIALALLLLGSQDAVEADGQPLSINAGRLIEALDFLGIAPPVETREAVKAAGADAVKLQRALDPLVVFQVEVKEDGLSVTRGKAAARLQQAGYTPVLVKVVNRAARTGALEITSPQSGPVYAGVAPLSMRRQQQEPLRKNENVRGDDRFLGVEIFRSPPMTRNLGGAAAEYVLALIYSSAAGSREATIGFRLGKAAGRTKVRFEVRPAIRVKLSVRDVDGTPTAGRFTFRDKAGHVYPPQPKRLAPDFFFQKQIYRPDGGFVLLPPGRLTMEYSRGPEYRLLKRPVTIPREGGHTIEVRLERWVDPAAYGFYGGDHHIHASGCAHYTKPSEGVLPKDMFLQVKGEGLNVGCVLTWGPAFAYQHKFFSSSPHQLSEPFTLIKYDIEVSGFGSAALGHVCLLNLSEQIYPGAEESRGWPTWTTPVLRWAKRQGAVTGYAHSASGLQIDPPAASKRLVRQLDRDRDGALSGKESARGLLPEAFATIDRDDDGLISVAELTRSHDRAADQLPNYANPEMNGVGAMEVCVTVAQGLCDFISAMDTARIPEWNCWYHILNCGFPLKLSGETDFPCMSGTRVGQGRVYVQLGRTDKVDYADWCEGVARGRSYVSDGYAHALEFTVNGKPAGGEVRLDGPTEVEVRAKVAFGAQTPVDVPYGGAVPESGRRLVGDTILLYKRAWALDLSKRRVDLVVNGRVAASREVPADDREHDLSFKVKIDRSSWVALRQFPQMHTNPVNVIVGGRPIRASRKSALWCIGTIEQLWRSRERRIAKDERAEAERTFKMAIETYRKIAEASIDQENSR